MAVEVTLSRDGDTVSIPLLDAGAGGALLAVDVGKPQLDIHETGVLNPRSFDNWSGLEQFTILGRFIGSSAYSDAISLADLIKSYSGGNNMTLSVPLSEFDDTINVAPAAGQEESLALVYPPGRGQEVQLDLGLTRVDDTEGSGTQDASTPTSGGTGPIQLKRGSTTVDLSSDIEVRRGIGRHNSTVRRSRKEFPRYFDKRKTAYDAFELSFQFVSNPASTVQTLVNDVFRPRLGRDAIQLDFNGMFGMGSFDVVPSGSGALRHVRPSGMGGVKLVPTVNLRRVRT